VIVSAGGPTADEPRIEYRLHPDADPEAEARVLAAVYAFILDCHQRRGVPAEVGGDNRTEGGHAGESSEESPTKKGSA